MSDWRKLEAGPELDRLIAERRAARLQRRVGIRAKLDVIPEYSTSTNVALGLWRGLYINLHNEDGSLWTAAISPGIAFRDLAVASAVTPALAICRAWLAYRDAQAT